MNAAIIRRVVSLIPERATRRLSGTVFAASQANASPQREQLGHLARLLQWLSPLAGISRSDQGLLGLIAFDGKTVSSAPDEDEGDSLGSAADDDDERPGAQ